MTLVHGRRAAASLNSARLALVLENVEASDSSLADFRLIAVLFTALVHSTLKQL